MKFYNSLKSLISSRRLFCTDPIPIRKVFTRVYGCQMNVADAEVMTAILKEKNKFVETKDLEDADVCLLVTCSIREGAETKIWNRIASLKEWKRRAPQKRSVGILGCMAERLKTDLIEKSDGCVDVVCGPDAYRDLPNLINSSFMEPGLPAINTQLSLEETYADINPVKFNPGSPSAFLSIQRGCDNMCSFCVVPFVRGRERSRPISSILDEISHLHDNGVKDVLLLGQNVNSYRDLSEQKFHGGYDPGAETKVASGFKSIYKPKVGGRRFADLLENAANKFPEMRFRFTSPHPKDFPDEVLDLISEKVNICSHIHLPAQSGSTKILQLMRRNHTKESYLELVDTIRRKIPDVTLSSDFIAGFCDESEEDHLDTLDVIRKVRYNAVFNFPYSLRPRTHADRKLNDNVSQDDKNRRHTEISDLWRQIATEHNRNMFVDTIQCVLIEGDSRRSADRWQGRCDGNLKTFFDKTPDTRIGDFVAVKVDDANSQSLGARFLFKTSLQIFRKDIENYERSNQEQLKEIESSA